ncbi:glutaredoxin domain containing protein [Pseudohyphozyma bogoriensis]|nr:glutaredoxin domain containing protein [Pseudohyphozyma bogoriensis]
MLPSTHRPSYDDDKHHKRRLSLHSSFTTLARRFINDPKLLLTPQYRAHAVGGALFVVLIIVWIGGGLGGRGELLVEPLNLKGEATNWGDYVALGHARAKVLSSTPPSYADLGDKWVGGSGPLYHSRSLPFSSTSRDGIDEAVAKKSSVRRTGGGFESGRHGVLGGASVEWSAGVVGMGRWLGDRVDMMKDSGKRQKRAEEGDDEGVEAVELEEAGSSPARRALSDHILNHAWLYLDEEDETNTKKMLAKAEKDGTVNTLPLRDRVRGDAALRREASVGWSRIFAAMEGETGKSALEVAVEKLVRRAPVVVFGLTTCPHSQRAKDLLQKYNLSPAPYFVEVDLRPDAANLKKLLARKTGHSTFPNIILGSKSIGGADDLEKLEREGEFEIVLKESGVEIHGR